MLVLGNNLISSVSGKIENCRNYSTTLLEREGYISPQDNRSEVVYRELQRFFCQMYVLSTRYDEADF